MQYPAHSHSLRQHTNQIETDEISNTPFKKKLKKKSNRNATTIIKQNKKTAHLQWIPFISLDCFAFKPQINKK